MKSLGVCLSFALILIIGLVFIILNYATQMPGTSYQGILPVPDQHTLKLQRLLYQHVYYLAETIGERHYEEEGSLERASEYVQQQLHLAGYEANNQVYSYQNKIFSNVVAIKQGSNPQKPELIIGAHYDTIGFSPGANDNASGVAVLIELARLLESAPLQRTVQFVAFTNEESPFYFTEGMGSYVFANSIDKPASILGMISLEMLGYYSQQENSQKYPFPFSFLYPDTGNFIAFVGDMNSSRFLRRSIRVFRKHAIIPSEGLVAPQTWVPDIARSDQVSFWKRGIPAFMLTDTAEYRYPHYHFVSDLPRFLDYQRMSYLTQGLVQMIQSLDKIN